LHQRGIRVILCEANARVLAKLQRAGVVNEISIENYAGSLVEAVKQAAVDI
jgi:riboflavin biosynthesis pyrimidine reductase